MSAPFTSQEYQALLQELESLADPQYKAFHEGLIPGVSMAWGVRLPALRGLAKKLLRGDPVGFLEKTQPGSYEETLLRGLVIGGLNLPWEGKRPWVEDFLPRIDNWAVCDTFCNSLKPRSPEDRRGMWAFFRPPPARGGGGVSRPRGRAHRDCGAAPCPAGAPRAARCAPRAPRPPRAPRRQNRGLRA